MVIQQSMAGISSSTKLLPPFRSLITVTFQHPLAITPVKPETDLVLEERRALSKLNPIAFGIQKEQFMFIVAR